LPTGYVQKLRLPKKVVIDMTEANNDYIALREGRQPTIYCEEWALEQIGCGYDGHNFTFPMTDEHGTVIGIKKRTAYGGKFCDKGSSLGLYYHKQPRQDLLLLPEGESDTIAAIMLGYFAVGRPNCNACRTMISNFIRYTQVNTAVIVADNDKAGIVGAKKIRETCYTGNVKIITPPAKFKDLRQWVEAGAKRQVIDYMISIAGAK